MAISTAVLKLCRPGLRQRIRITTFETTRFLRRFVTPLLQFTPYRFADTSLVRSFILFVALILGLSNTAALNQDTLTELLEPIQIEHEMPGLRAAVLLPDGTLIQSATGLADVENNIPLDHEIGMPGGSTGKSFVSTLVMLLVEDGTLSLDDFASKWLSDEPWFAELPNNQEIRVRHLLSHSSGLSDYPGTTRYTVLSIWRALFRGGIKFTPDELIDMVTNKKPLYPVGEGFAYSDSGYLVLGKIIEAATGRDFYELLQERILDPEELRHVQPQNESVLTDVAPGYSRGARNLREDGTMKSDPTSEWTGGGLITTPTMLVEFYRALARGEIVSPSSFEAMKNSGWQNPDSSDWHYGYGLFVTHSGNVVEHGGLWMGYRTHVRHYLDEQLTIAVQTNRDGSIDLEAIVDQIAPYAN